MAFDLDRTFVSIHLSTHFSCYEKYFWHPFTRIIHYFICKAEGDILHNNPREVKIDH